MNLKKYILLFLIFSFALYGHESEKAENSESKKEEVKEKESKHEKEEFSRKGPDPLPLGNFALPTSQQIAPLVSFGQLLVGEDMLQYCLLGSAYCGKETFISTLTPAILYGLSDEMDIYLQIPIALGNFQDDCFSSGIQDIVLQFEYAFYGFNTCWYTDQATVVAAILYPSGNPNKIPNTGCGAPSFFIGGTFSRVSRWWYGFVSIGALYPTEKHDTKFGDEYYYQFGYGRVICAKTEQFIFDWILEFDGTYGKRNCFQREFDLNSGGNEILITPSLWFSTPHWVIQAGLGFPVIQNFKGRQPKTCADLFFTISYTL